MRIKTVISVLIKLAFISSAILLLGSCSYNNNDVAGKYCGVIPDASGVKKDISLTLYKDGSYTEQTVTVEEYPVTDVITGEFELSDDIIHLAPNNPLNNNKEFRIEGKKLVQLKESGAKLAQALNESYMLNKISD